MDHDRKPRDCPLEYEPTPPLRDDRLLVSAIVTYVVALVWAVCALAGVL